jgi:hypothetical protein
MSRSTQKDQAEHLGKLKTIRQNLIDNILPSGLDASSVRKYLEWNKLRDEEKDDIHEEWLDYYKRCWTTKAALRLQKMQELYRQKQYKLVAKYAQKAKEQLESGELELTEPQYIDGYELIGSDWAVRYYLEVTRRIDEVESGDEWEKSVKRAFDL